MIMKIVFIFNLFAGILQGFHSATLYFNASINSSNTHSTTYRAAVYEHKVIFPDDPEVVLSRYQALRWIKKNLNVFSLQTKKASEKGAEIIVFPEDGLYGWDHTRESKRPFLEPMPDPERIHWNPCEDPKRFPNTEVQRFLSCMAKDNGIYVVANMGQVEPCSKLEDPRCPDDGRFQYNTNVVYDPNGHFIVRYRKYYLYYEVGFDVPKKQEIKTFDTPFGRFGTFVCADLIYKTPAFDLVHELGVENIAFPTAWDNLFPYNVAIQAQQGYALANQVNLLAADTQDIFIDMGGSGIYSSSKTLRFVYNTETDQGRLLIADVPRNPRQYPGNSESVSVSNNVRLTNTTIQAVCSDTTFNSTLNKSSQFTANMIGDELTFIPLSVCEDKVKVCHGSFCCSLDYKFRTREPDELFALGAWSGLHTYLIRLSNQLCTVVRCASSDPSSCGKDTREAFSTFDKFVLEGTFEAETVFPRLLTVENEEFDLSASDWTYEYGKITSEAGFNKPLLSATLYGRRFSKDPKFTV